MSIGEPVLLFTFLDSTRVTDQETACESGALRRKSFEEEPPSNVAWRLSSSGLFGFRSGDPAGPGNFAMSLIIVEKFHWMIGMSVRYRTVIDGTESRSVVRNGQRIPRGVRRFVESRSAGRQRANENAVWIAVRIRDTDVIGNHGPVVRDGKPADTHGAAELGSGRPGCTAVGGRGESDIQLTRGDGAIRVRVIVVDDGDMGAGTGSRGVGADAGKEVIDGAGSSVDRDAGYGAPCSAIRR